VDTLTECGTSKGLTIERPPVSGENDVKLASAQLGLENADILWQNQNRGELIGPCLESLADVPGVNRVSGKDAPDVAFDIDGHKKTVPFTISSDTFSYGTVRDWQLAQRSPRPRLAEPDGEGIGDEHPEPPSARRFASPPRPSVDAVV
jgi:hypothetical protein